MQQSQSGQHDTNGLKRRGSKIVNIHICNFSSKNRLHLGTSLVFVPPDKMCLLFIYFTTYFLLLDVSQSQSCLYPFGSQSKSSQYQKKHHFGKSGIQLGQRQGTHRIQGHSTKKGNHVQKKHKGQQRHINIVFKVDFNLCTFCIAG